MNNKVKSITRVASLILAIIMLVSSFCTINVHAEETIDFEAIKANFPDTVTIPTLDTTNIGYNIQRTMHLLETSTAEKPNTVRIAFYGQSMIDPNNEWPAMLIEELRKKYPTANIIASNLGVGGFAAGYQQRMVESDMKEFYPDLTLYYASGEYNTYSNIVEYLRKYTLSEVMFINNVTGDASVYDLAGANGTSLEPLCKDYNCELVDVYSMFYKFYEINKNKDGTPLNGYYCFNPPPEGHFSDNGQRVMTEIVKQFFVYKPTDAESSWKTDRVTELTVGKDINWENGKLTVDTQGNRYEVVTGTANDNAATVAVNGKKPSEILDLYYHTRIYDDTSGSVDPYWYKGGWLKVDLLDIPVQQEWTIELTEADREQQSYSYKLTGSVTGDEGVGSSKEVFTSKSGTIGIDPEDAFTAGSENVVNTDGSTSTGFYSVGNQYKFKTVLNGTDSVASSSKESNTVLLASGLTDVDNVLTIEANDASKLPDIQKIIVYRPKVKNDVVTVPKGLKLVDNTKILGGTTMPLGVLVGEYKGKVFSTEADRDGIFLINLPKKIPAGDKVTFYVNHFNDKSEEFVLTSKPRKPSVKKVTIKSKVITGKATPKAKITIKYKKMSKTVKCKANGKYNFKLNKKWSKALKVKGKITLVSKINGVQSSIKTIKIKKK